jgi:MerR family transcriptional regulator, mercuric resistance operon regulatory protein
MSTRHYTIGELAGAAGVHVETVRYYQRIGLVDQPKRPPGGIRRYTTAHARRLQFIRKAQLLGFSLAEIAELLALNDGSQCHEAAEIGSRKLETVRAGIAQLRRVEKALVTLVDECCRSTGRVRCPLIATLDDADAGQPVA